MVTSEFMTNRRDGIDLTVYQCGMEICKPAHYYGPAVRDHYLIHYILNGQGTFHVDGKKYRLGRNQGFLICPNVITYYEADKLEPWIYTWVGFQGIKAEQYLKYANLTRENPVFQYDRGPFMRDCFSEMIESSKLKRSSEIRLQGLLYMFLSELIETSDQGNNLKENQKDMYVKKSIQFIEMNYSRDITVCDIAEHLGLNRSYFSALFKEATHTSPQEFLVRYRVNKAVELMKQVNLSISEISRSVGYNDPLTFSKIFKKVKGSSPRKYREEIINL